MGLPTDVPTPDYYNTVISCDPHFTNGFFDLFSKHKPPSMKQYGLSTSALYKPPAVPNPDFSYLRLLELWLSFHLNVSPLLTQPVNKKTMLKRLLYIESHNDHITTAAYINVSAAQDSAVRNNILWL